MRVGGPAWSPGEPTLTVSEIAERLQPFEPRIKPEMARQLMVEKVRHWTRAGMLLPVAQHHGGAGKHRQYAASAVFDAAVLYVATSVGLDVPTQQRLVDALTQARFRLKKWLDAKRRAQKLPPSILYIWRLDGQISSDFDVHKAEPELLITIDCGRLWLKVWKEGG